MKRNLIEKLIQWKNTNSYIPLIINGMKGVGKTRLMYDFAIENYNSHLYFNFETDVKISGLFSCNLENTKAKICDYFNSDISFNSTLLILDEFTHSPEAIEFINSIKASMGDNNLNVIAAYSYSYYSKDKYTNLNAKYLTLYPLTFDEYLNATGNTWYCETIQEHFLSNKPLPEIVHNELLDLFNEYMYIGGMPDAINEYLVNRSFININERHNIIIQHILMNINRLIEPGQYIKLMNLYETIPNQLMKENKKFQYSLIRKGATAKIYENELDILVNLGIVNKCLKKGSKDDFKAYLCDFGVLFSLAKGEYNNLFLESLIENYTCQTLIANGYSPTYWESKSQAKINFVIECNGKLQPIEVKNSENTRSKNYSIFKENYPDCNNLIKISTKNFSYSKNVKFIPLYAVFCI